MPTNWVRLLAPALTAILLRALLGRAGRSVPPPPGTSPQLTYGRGMVILGVGVLLFALLMSLVYVASPPEGRGDVLALVGLLGGFAPAGLYVAVEARWARVYVSRDGIISASPWRRPKALAWRDVASVHFSRALCYLVLTGRDGGTIRVSPYLTGFPFLLDVVAERVGEDVAGRAVREVRDYIEGRAPGGRPRPPVSRARAAR